MMHKLWHHLAYNFKIHFTRYLMDFAYVVIFKPTDQLELLTLKQCIVHRLYLTRGLSLTIVLTIRAARRSCRTIQVVASRTLTNYAKSVNGIVQLDRWRIAADRTWLRSLDARVTSTHPPRADESPARACGTVSWALFRRSRSRIRRFRHRVRSRVSAWHSHNFTHTYAERYVRPANVALRRLLFH